VPVRISTDHAAVFNEIDKTAITMTVSVGD
jgi:hypothetical protein